MKEKRHIKVALVGNPNSGKTTLFNQLTGLSQRTGNYPGVTVEKKSGFFSTDEEYVEILDLPGVYSLYPRTLDEEVVMQELFPSVTKKPDLVLVVADSTNLSRSLLLLSEIVDLGFPTILALNMSDVLAKRGNHIHTATLEKRLGIRSMLINARDAQGIDTIKKLILGTLLYPPNFWSPPIEAVELIEKAQTLDPSITPYLAWQISMQKSNFYRLPAHVMMNWQEWKNQTGIVWETAAIEETKQRYEKINRICKEAIIQSTIAGSSLTQKADRLLTHPVWGYLILFIVHFFVFQAIFSWAAIPMELIDSLFGKMSFYLSEWLPSSWITRLITEGILPGIGGVVIFIPQILFLFLFITLLEESGYMARVVFLSDRFMRLFGLGGKSIVPLISGAACAIPAIMATRTIESWRERLITILVTPFMTCSARLPVYAIIISTIIPEKNIGPFGLQGLVLFGLYLLGFATALLAALFFHLLIKAQERSYLIMEMPHFKLPKWSNLLYVLKEKTWSFVGGAGKIILAISIFLWFLASYGPSDRIANAIAQVEKESTEMQWTPEDKAYKMNAAKLENSWAGIAGKFIEPAIAPLGFDWKIGIALITSFAAREVFVGTMATIYSVGENFEEDGTLQARLRAEKKRNSDEPQFNFATGIALLLFYAFAMQCISTIAIVKRETNGWKWPIIQTTFMMVIAYFSALIAYQLLK